MNILKVIPEAEMSGVEESYIEPTLGDRKDLK